MDKLPLNSNSLTSTTSSYTTTNTTTTTTSTTHWDLAMSSMDANHHHQIFHGLQNQAIFPFSSIPTWQSYSLPPPPSSSSSFIFQGSRAMAKQMETLVEAGEEKEDREAEQEADDDEDEDEELGAVKEMMYKIAAMQPVEIDPATIRRPKRRNVRISDDPQSVAARLRRERISEKIRILQRLVPGGTKLDTASMLEEAVRYVKFLKRQIRHLQAPPRATTSATTTTATTSVATAARRDFEGDQLPLCFSFNEG